jgi:hypothetical protein
VHLGIASGEQRALFELCLNMVLELLCRFSFVAEHRLDIHAQFYAKHIIVTGYRRRQLCPGTILKASWHFVLGYETQVRARAIHRNKSLCPALFRGWVQAWYSYNEFVHEYDTTAVVCSVLRYKS